MVFARCLNFKSRFLYYFFLSAVLQIFSLFFRHSFLLFICCQFISLSICLIYYLSNTSILSCLYFFDQFRLSLHLKVVKSVLFFRESRIFRTVIRTCAELNEWPYTTMAQMGSLILFRLIVFIQIEAYMLWEYLTWKLCRVVITTINISPLLQSN